MNKELQDKLMKKYPKIFYKGIDSNKTVTCMYLGIECHDGWYDLIDSLCYRISMHCTAQNTRYIVETGKYEFVVEGDPEYMQVVAAQVKEKMGELRFYVDGGDATTQGMIQMAEAMSSRICELCGSPAKTSRDSGWFHTACDACNKRIRLERQGWKSGSAEEFLADTDSGSWGWLADSDQPESNPDNNPDKVSQLKDTKLRKGIEEAKQGKFSKTPPKIRPTKKKKKK